MIPRSGRPWWILPGCGSRYRIVQGWELQPAHRPRAVSAALVAPLLDRWLSSCSDQVLQDMGRSLGDVWSSGRTVLDQAEYRQRLKQRLAQAFRRGELVALVLEERGTPEGPWASSGPTEVRAQPSSQPPPLKKKDQTFIAIRMRGEDGQPVPAVRYRITLPDGSAQEGLLDDQGSARIDGIQPGQCEVTFPELDGSAWR